MMKLVHNCLREYQTITIPGTGNVKWQHIQHLHEKQVSEGLRLGNKLSAAHINYKTQKMKVKLAVQVLSSTCASVLEYLTTCELQQFADTFATECFLRRLDQLFDHLNCRSLYGTPHGKPLLGQIMGCYWHFGSGLPALVTCTARADMPAVANQQWATSCHKQQPIDVFTSTNPLLTLK